MVLRMVSGVGKYILEGAVFMVVFLSFYFILRGSPSALGVKYINAVTIYNNILRFYFTGGYLMHSLVSHNGISMLILR